MAIRYANQHPQLLDQDWLRDQYVAQGKSSIVIAAELGCTSQMVQYRLRQAGIEARPRSARTRMSAKKCERCGSEFTPKGPAGRFCSRSCRVGIRSCEFCGESFLPAVSEAVTGQTYVQRYCSDDCRAAGRLATRYEPRPCEQCGAQFKPHPPREVNGKIYPQRFCCWACRKAYWSEHSAHEYVHKSSGYVWVQVWDEEGGNAGRRLKHHWVMEQQLGRRLYPHEEVHHKNGIRSDNDPGNLELWTTSQPKGQRVEDKITWAVEFLEQYGFSCHSA